jgi:4-amino-4-deoxy-L-arabinose transferase-like glycosyltransferase
MARSGDWVTPRLNGSPWFEKPPLIYWTTGAANRIGLHDEWAARLPVALMSLAFLAFFLETLTREFSLRVALAATAILSGSAGWLTASFGAVPDLPMSAALGAAILVALFGSDPRRGWAAGVLLALATLAKGLVPLALFAPVWLIARGKRFAIVVATLLVAGPWYVLCLIRNGSAFWNEFFWKHHVARLLSGEALQHDQPFWYYVPVLLAGLFPWTPLAALIFRRGTYEDVRVRFLLAWCGLVFVFFSAVPNKLPLYILPILPGFAIVLAAALDKAPSRGWWLGASMMLLVLLPSIGNVLPEAFLSGATRVHWAFDPRGVPVIIAAVAVWWFARTDRMIDAILIGAAAIVVSIGYLKLQALPVLDQRASARAFFRAHPTEMTSACADANVPRSFIYGLEYYAGRSLPECGSETASPRIHWKSRALTLDAGS